MGGDAPLFAHSTYIDTHYLVVAKDHTGALQGNLLELLLRRTGTPVDTAALIAALYHGYQQNTPTPASQGDGYCSCIFPPIST